MEIKLLRQPTTAGGTVAYEFGVSCTEYLIKNFTDGDIYVAFDEAEDNPILIPADTSQVCVCNYGLYWGYNAADIVYIRADATSERGVEVQCLKW